MRFYASLFSTVEDRRNSFLWVERLYRYLGKTGFSGRYKNNLSASECRLYNLRVYVSIGSGIMFQGLLDLRVWPGQVADGHEVTATPGKGPKGNRMYRLHKVRFLLELAAAYIVSL